MFCSSTFGFNLTCRYLFPAWILVAAFLLEGGHASKASQEFIRGSTPQNQRALSLMTTDHPILSHVNVFENEATAEDFQEERADRGTAAGSRNVHRAAAEKKTQQIAESANEDDQDTPNRELGRRRSSMKDASLVPIYSSLWKGKFISPYKPPIPVKMPYPNFISDLSKIIPKGTTPKAPLKMLPAYSPHRHLSKQTEEYFTRGQFAVSSPRDIGGRLNKAEVVGNALYLGLYGEREFDKSAARTLQATSVSEKQPLSLLPLFSVNELISRGGRQVSLLPYIRRENSTSPGDLGKHLPNGIAERANDTRSEAGNGAEDLIQSIESGSPRESRGSHAKETHESDSEDMPQSIGREAQLENELSALQSTGREPQLENELSSFKYGAGEGESSVDTTFEALNSESVESEAGDGTPLDAAELHKAVKKNNPTGNTVSEGVPEGPETVDEEYKSVGNLRMIENSLEMPQSPEAPSNEESSAESESSEGSLPQSDTENPTEMPTFLEVSIDEETSAESESSLERERSLPQSDTENPTEMPTFLEVSIDEETSAESDSSLERERSLPQSDIENPTEMPTFLEVSIDEETAAESDSSLERERSLPQSDTENPTEMPTFLEVRIDEETSAESESSLERGRSLPQSDTENPIETSQHLKVRRDEETSAESESSLERERSLPQSDTENPIETSQHLEVRRDEEISAESESSLERERSLPQSDTENPIEMPTFLEIRRDEEISAESESSLERERSLPQSDTENPIETSQYLEVRRDEETFAERESSLERERSLPQSDIENPTEMPTFLEVSIDEETSAERESSLERERSLPQSDIENPTEMPTFLEVRIDEETSAESDSSLKRERLLPQSDIDNPIVEEQGESKQRSEERFDSSSDNRHAGPLVQDISTVQESDIINSEGSLGEPKKKSVHLPQDLPGNQERSQAGDDDTFNRGQRDHTLAENRAFSESESEILHEGTHSGKMARPEDARCATELGQSSIANHVPEATGGDEQPRQCDTDILRHNDEKITSDFHAAVAADVSSDGRGSFSPAVGETEETNWGTRESPLQGDNDKRRLLMLKKRYTADKNPWSVRARAQPPMVFYYPPPKKYEEGVRPKHSLLYGNLPSLSPPPPCYGAGCYRRLVGKYHHVPTVPAASAQPITQLSSPTRSMAAVQVIPFVFPEEESKKKKRERPERPVKPPRPPRPQRVEEPPKIRYIPISKEYVPLMVWPPNTAPHMKPHHHSHHAGGGHGDFYLDDVLFDDFGDGDEMDYYHDGPPTHGHERTFSFHDSTTGGPAGMHTHTPSDVSSTRGPTAMRSSAPSAPSSAPPSSGAAAGSPAGGTPSSGGNGADSFPSVPPPAIL